MQVGLDIVTSAKYKSHQQFRLDEYLSAFVLIFNKIFLISSGYGQTEYKFPTCIKPCSLHAITSTPNKMDDYILNFKKYSSESLKYYKELLLKNDSDEKAFQHFFERNVSFIPGAHSEFGQARTGHDPIHGCLISQPKIRGLNTRIPDFMWLSYDSIVFSPVLIEIESPSKKLYNKDGSPTSHFVKAKNQLDEWRSHLSKVENQLNFYEDFDIDIETRRLDFEPFYILIYGRRSEYHGDEVLTKKRKTLVDKSSQQRLMSFDRLSPSEAVTELSCCYTKERKLQIISLGQGVALDITCDYLTKCHNVENGIDEMMFVGKRRINYLKKNINNFLKTHSDNGM
ncbi:MAG: DUF4263 domain-containing protein [Chitinophagaceae bacterium]|nr:DUF4263 domain-containing protein [Chitinophagaceae bacterium]